MCDPGREDDWSRELAAAVAHAVRGPFAAAVPAVGMLLDGVLGELDPRQRDALQTVDRALQRAFADSCDLVTLLSGELVHTRLLPAPCPAGDLLARALVLAGPEATESVRLEVVSGLPPAFVDRDRTALALALLIGCCHPAAGSAGCVRLTAGPRRRAAGTAQDEPADPAAAGAGQHEPADPAGRGSSHNGRAAGALEPAAAAEGIEIRIHACEAGGLKPGGVAADYPRESAGLLACRAIVEAQNGRLDVSGGRPAARSQEPGSQDISETAAALVWLPAVPACREGDRA
jgi:hypothetical protein